MIAQTGIVIFGVLAVWLSQSASADARRWACIAGLCAQPFWYVASWNAGQMGIFAISFLYTASWLRGFYNHWIKDTP